MLNEAPELLGFARAIVEAVVRGGDPARLPPPATPAERHGGVFVTLRKLGRLRGCMGTLEVNLPLGEAVRRAAADATRDPRFPPLSASELAELRFELSVLSAPVRTDAPLSLQLGTHGILIRHGSKRGLFLPQVAAEHRLSAVDFLSRCCSEKAGLPPDAWRDPRCEVLLFTTQVVRESDLDIMRG